MIVLDGDVEDVSQDMTPEKLMEELEGIFCWSRDSDEIYRWTMYGIIPVGTVFHTDMKLSGCYRLWYELSKFEDAVWEHGFDPEPIEFFPNLEPGDTIMFLGMTEELYPFEKVVVNRPTVRGRTFSSNAIVVDDRPYPKWLVGEKVYIYPLKVEKYDVLRIGTGPRAASQMKTWQKSKGVNK